MRYRPLGSNAVGCGSRADSIIDFCCIHRSIPQQWLIMLYSGGKSPIMPLLLVDRDPYLIHGSLGPLEYTLHSASRSVQPCLQGLRTWPTDRHTDWPRYSVCSNRPHQAIAAMRPKNWPKSKNRGVSEIVFRFLVKYFQLRICIVTSLLPFVVNKACHSNLRGRAELHLGRRVKEFIVHDSRINLAAPSQRCRGVKRPGVGRVRPVGRPGQTYKMWPAEQEIVAADHDDGGGGEDGSMSVGERRPQGLDQWRGTDVCKQPHGSRRVSDRASTSTTVPVRRRRVETTAGRLSVRTSDRCSETV